MVTDSNIPAQKKVVSVEILHLDEVGYGPQGKHTRREWRAECLENLLAGKERFEAWQTSWQNNIKENLPKVSFECLVQYKDGNTKTVLAGYWNNQNAFALDFTCLTFKALAVFDYEFNSDVCFSGSTFIKTAGFAGAIFKGVADFTAAIFKNAAWFSKSLFVGDAWFQEGVFTEAGYFDDVTFSSDVWFDRAVFIDLITFSSSAFLNKSGFVKVHFDSECVFDDSTFRFLASFENATFVNIGHFEKASFSHQFPSFRGCQIDRTRLEFSDKDQFPPFESGADAIKNISFLKRLSDEQGQIDQALMFNAFELNAKRVQAYSNTHHLSFKQKIFSSDYYFAKATDLYEEYSDYGRSFTKPLLGYLALLLITFSLALGHALYLTERSCDGKVWWLFTNLWHEDIKCEIKPAKEGETPIRLTAWRAAVEYTSYRASGILDFADSDKQTIAVANRLFGQPIEPPWMRAWGIFKAIASTALLFLAALGLRNKYRIK